MSKKYRVTAVVYSIAYIEGLISAFPQFLKHPFMWDRSIWTERPYSLYLNFRGNFVWLHKCASNTARLRSDFGWRKCIPTKPTDD